MALPGTGASWAQACLPAWLCWPRRRRSCSYFSEASGIGGIPEGQPGQGAASAAAKRCLAFCDDQELARLLSTVLEDRPLARRLLCSDGIDLNFGRENGENGTALLSGPSMMANSFASLSESGYDRVGATASAASGRSFAYAADRDAWRAKRFRREKCVAVPNKEESASSDDPNIIGVSDVSLSVPGKAHAPIVQFASYLFVEDEASLEVVLSVMRIGDCSRRSVTNYSTLDKSAKAGITYEGTRGALVFEAGETWKEIRVPLIVSAKRRWEFHAAEEFVVFFEKEGLENVTMARYLWQTRVQIFNKNSFPTNKYKSVFTEDCVDTPEWGLLLQYFKMNWRNPVVRRGTIRIVFLNLVHNLHFLLTLYLDVFLVDTVLTREGFRKSELGLYALMVVLPLGVLHVLDYSRLSWRVEGASLKILQGSLYWKFIHLDHQRHGKVRSGELVVAITRFGDTVVSGYMDLFLLLLFSGKLIMAFLFQCRPRLLSGAPIDPLQFVLGTWPLFGFPVLLFALLAKRTGTTTRVLAQKNHEELQLVDGLQDAVLNYQVIRDYRRRFWMTDCFEAQVDRKNGATVAADQVILNNIYYAKWLNKFFVVAYVILGGMEFMSSDPNAEAALSLGMFLATLRAYRNIGNAWCDIYESLLRIQQVIPALRQFAVFLNLRSDLVQFSPHLKDRIRRTKEHFQECDGVSSMMPIVVRQSSIIVTAPGRCSHLSYDGLLEIPQGNLVCFVGPQSGGKATLLRMLGSMMRPTDPNSIFVPSHLRVLNASFEAMFMRGTLFSNLVFGVTGDDRDGSRERVLAICRKVGLPDDILQLVEHDVEAVNWEDLLSQTESFLLSIVRALVANPEVMCLHKLALTYDDQTSDKVWKTLREFVECRGLGEDPSSWHLRHPRTCIVSGRVSDMMCHPYADQIIKLDRSSMTRLR